MSARDLLRVVATLVVLLVLWGMFVLFRGSISEPVTSLPLPALTPGDVDSIQIVTPEYTLRFGRRAERWQVNGAAADPEQIRQLFAALSDSVAMSELMARNPESHARLGVVSTGRRIVMWQGDAVVLDLVVGGFAAGGFRSAYARLAGADEVFVVRGPLNGLARRPFESWRDRRIACVRTDRVQRIIIGHGHRETTLIRPLGDSTWMIGGQPADTAVVRRLMAALADITAIAFASDEEAASLDFERPDRRLTLVGRTADTLLAFAIDSTEAGFWVRGAGQPEIFRLDFWRVNELTPPAEELRGGGR